MEDAKARITIEHDVGAVEAEEQRRWSAVHEAEHAFVSAVCTSPAELLAKFDRLVDDELIGDEDVTAALRADIERLASANGSPPTPAIASADQMREWLDALAADPKRYLDLWLRLAETAKLRVEIEIDQVGDEYILWGQKMSDWSRERVAAGELLTDHLEITGHRQALIGRIKANGRYIDNRPNDPRETTHVLRELLATDARILIEPSGNLALSPCIPKSWGKQGEAHDARIMEASKRWDRLMRRHRSFAHIKRAVRMLGRTLPNGWSYLDAKVAA